MNLKFVTYFIFLFSLSISNERYLTIEKRFYKYIEYNVLKSIDCDLPFVLNQPFKKDDLKKIINDEQEIFKNRYLIYKISNNDINFSINPSFILKNKNLYKSINLDGQFSINNMLFVNNLNLDETLKDQVDFHGDTTNQWIVGYFDESYVTMNLKNTELFLGRMPRNFGTINEFSFLLSNYPFSYDHIGFTTSNQKLKYSFYTARLNDMYSYDIQDSNQYYQNNNWVKKLAKRYFSIQRLDIKIKNNFQISLSEASLYGGPDQNLIFSYINPVYFFYTAQRNQSSQSNVQMNGFWQLNVFYKSKKGFGVFFDLLVDDIIVNNVKGQNDTKVHPNRFAYHLKFSLIDQFKLKNMISFIYTRVDNETYLSYRTWENYIYFNRSLGYPYNSYESIKFEYLDLNLKNKNFEITFELYQQGNQDLKQHFTDEINEFPLPQVLKGLNSSFSFNLFNFKNFDFYFNINYYFKNDFGGKILRGSQNKDIIFEVKYFYK